MAERVAHLAVHRVVAVAHEHALAVVDLPFLAGEVQVGGRVGQPPGDRLGEAPGRVHGAEQHVDHTPTTGLAAEPGLQDRRGPALPAVHGHHPAVGEHHHHPRVHRGHGVEHRELGGRQVDVGPVEALALLAGR